MSRREEDREDDVDHLREFVSSLTKKQNYDMVPSSSAPCRGFKTWKMLLIFEGNFFFTHRVENGTKKNQQKRRSETFRS